MLESARFDVGHHDNSVEGAELDSDTVVVSLHGIWRRGRVHLNGAVNLGRNWVDIGRTIPLGASVRPECGSTEARLFGVDVGLGRTLLETGIFRHGLKVRISWLDQSVDGYHESGGSSTAMNFSDFDRESLVLRGGYWVSGVLDVHGVSVRPYTGVAYEREFEDEPVSVTAGSNTMAGRFTASGFVPPQHWASIDAGVSASLNGWTSAVLGYSGRYGDGGREDHLLNVGLRIAF